MPLFDWPETSPAADTLWSEIRSRFVKHDIAAPESLDRQTPFSEGARRADLVMGQTCGLPYVRRHRGHVAILGAFSFELPDTPSGHYRSAVVAHRDDPRRMIDEFRGARVAVNEGDSWSGNGALAMLTAPLAEQGRFFGEVRRSGGHRRSMEMVAAGAAEIASIDIVHWRIAEQALPFTKKLRVITETAATPSLPLVAPLNAPHDTMRACVAEAVEALSPADRSALIINGFQPFADADYQLVADRDAAAKAFGYVELDDPR